MKAAKQRVRAVQQPVVDIPLDYHEEGDYDDSYEDLSCEHCSGTGGDPWNDGILPCKYCDGQGYRWWE